MFVEVVTYILAGLLFLFIVVGLCFVLEASARKDENCKKRCSACLQDGLCFCENRDEVTYK